MWYKSINSLCFLDGRLVLSAVSDYFAAMFTSDVREAKQEEIDHFSFKNYSCAPRRSRDAAVLDL